MEIELRQFDINDTKDDKVVVLYNIQIIPFLCKDFIIIPIYLLVRLFLELRPRSFYSKTVPKLFIHEEYQPPIIQNILKRR